MTSAGNFGLEVVAQRLADLLNTSVRRGDQIDEAVWIVNRNLRASPTAPQQASGADPLRLLNLDDPATYLLFFADALH